MPTGTTGAAGEQDVRAVESAHLLQVYKRVPVVLTRGEGSYVHDADGRRYLDFVSGLGVASLGHAHAGLADALADQARTLVHTSNLYFHPCRDRWGGGSRRCPACRGRSSATAGPRRWRAA